MSGTSASPLVDGTSVIAHVGGHESGALTSFDAATGKPRWQWNGDGPAYGSPIIATFGGVRQVIAQTQKLLVGLEAPVPLPTGPLVQVGVTAGVNVKLAKCGGPGPAAQMLARAHELGFRTFLGCMEETSVAGPIDQWPLARGFDRYYGFLQGETDQFTP